MWTQYIQTHSSQAYIPARNHIAIYAIIEFSNSHRHKRRGISHCSLLWCSQPATTYNKPTVKLRSEWVRIVLWTFFNMASVHVIHPSQRITYNDSQILSHHPFNFYSFNHDRAWCSFVFLKIDNQLLSLVHVNFKVSVTPNRHHHPWSSPSLPSHPRT